MLSFFRFIGMRLSFIISRAKGKLRAMSTTEQFRLLDLPNELIIRVVESVEDVATLSRLACTSRRMQELAEPVLYRRILIQTVPRAHSFLSAFDSCPQRALSVQHLEIAANPAMLAHVRAMRELLRKVHKVKDLMIESPLVNSPNFESQDVWRLMTDLLFQPFKAAVSRAKVPARPMQQLTNLTLHLNGPMSPYWDVDSRSLCVFQSRTLQKIHVSCMNLSGEAFSRVEDRFCTPLKHLILEECNVTVSGLKNILTLPKALEILYLGENCYNSDQFRFSEIDPAANLLFHGAPEETLGAIKSQAHSLKAITYATTENHGRNMWYRVTSQIQHANFETGGFADFLALEKIHMIGKCSNFEHAVLCGCSPPRLRELIADSYVPLWKSGCRKASDKPSTEDLIGATPFLRVNSPCIPESLTKITINYVYKDERPVALRESEGTTISETAKALKDKFALTLSVGYKFYGRYFPPFLHGEPLPQEGEWYHGASGWFSEEFKKEVSGPPYPFDDSDLDDSLFV